MNKKSEPFIDEVMAKINQVAERMKHAKDIGDKVGYDIALKEYEYLYKKYSHILYKSHEPAGVYVKRL